MKPLESTATNPANRPQVLCRTDSTDFRWPSVARALIAVTAAVNAPALGARPILRADDSDTTGGFADCRCAYPVETGSTALRPPSSRLSDEIADVMQLGHGVFFEDGVESLFSTKLLGLINQKGTPAVEAFHNFVMAGLADERVAAEAFRWLGAMEDRKTYEARWRLLTCALQFPSLLLRDGALMGLSAMSDKRSLPSLTAALALKSNSPLKRDFEQLIRQLQQVR